MKMKSTYEKPSERKKSSDRKLKKNKKTSKIKKQILVRKMRKKKCLQEKLNGLIQKKVMDL